MRVNKAVLADVLGVSEGSLTEWQKESPPLPVAVRAKRRGQAHEYETRDVIEWMVQRRVIAVGAQSPRDRLYLAQLQEAELRTAEKLGQLVNVDQLEPELTSMAVAFKAHMLNIPGQFLLDAEDLAGDAARTAAYLEDSIRQALLEISSYDPASGRLNGHAAAADAAATASAGDEAGDAVDE